MKLFEIYNYDLPSYQELSRHLMYAESMDAAEAELRKYCTKGIMSRIDNIWVAGQDESQESRVVKHKDDEDV